MEEAQLKDVAPEDGNHDGARWQVKATVQKWASQADWEAGQAPDEVVVQDGNVLTNAGVNRLLTLAIGGGGTPWSNASARIGVGNSDAAEAKGQTDLQAAAGAANRYFKRVDAGYPRMEDVDGTLNVATGLYATWRATYTEAEANFDWYEWCIDNGVANGTVVTPVMLNRKVPDPDLGRKSGGVWSLTVSVTLL